MRAACNWDPEPEPSEPAGDDEPRTVTVTTRQAATLIASGSGITRQPPGPKVIISKAFIVYTNPAVRYQTTTILGTPIEVEFTPTSYTWGWGDGTTTTTTDPGAPYPHQTVTHHYQHTATGVTTTLTTTWTTRFRPTGEDQWRPIEGTITPTETYTLTLKTLTHTGADPTHDTSWRVPTPPLADLTETITLTHTDPNLAKAKITATEDQLLAHAGRGRTHVWATQQPWHNP